MQIDICAEELHNSVPASVAIQSDIAPAVKELTSRLAGKNYSMSKSNPWWRKLILFSEKNREVIHVSKISVENVSQKLLKKIVCFF